MIQKRDKKHLSKKKYKKAVEQMDDYKLYINFEPYDYVGDLDLTSNVYSISLKLFRDQLEKAGLAGLNDDYALIEYKGEPICCFNAYTDEIIPAKGALEKFEIYVCPLCRQMSPEENYTTLIVGPAGCTLEPCLSCMNPDPDFI